MKAFNLSLSHCMVIEDLEDVLEALRTLTEGRKTYFIIDDMMSTFYEKMALEIIQDENVRGIFNVEATEDHKNLATVNDIVNAMGKSGVLRDDVIVAIGGGLTTDLAGFVASVYMRGIEVIYVPTTLLAMVDACYGGKVGVNSAFGKNQIGGFHFATNIILARPFLDTLPESAYLSGLGEIVKYALLTDDFGQSLLRDQPLYSHEMIDFQYVVEALQTKDLYVRSDIKDQGIRKMLNVGHTIGHGLELAYELPHGIAVIYGMYLEMQLLQKMGYKMEEKLEAFKGLVPEDVYAEVESFDVHAYIDYLKVDKKNNDDGVGIVCLEGNKQKMIYVPLEVFYELLG